MKCIDPEDNIEGGSIVFSGEMKGEAGTHRTIINLCFADKTVSIELDERNGVTVGRAYLYGADGNPV